MNFVNLTPHDINIDGRVIPPSGMVARVLDKYVEQFNIDGIPAVIIENSEWGQLLPEIKNDTILLVSRAVAQVVKRRDVFFPFDFVRNREGEILECKKLARFSE